MVDVTDLGPMTAVRAFVEAFNNDDVDLIQVACEDETLIIDDFPPCAWSGSRAATRWYQDMVRMAGEFGMSEPSVRHVEVTADGGLAESLRIVGYRLAVHVRGDASAEQLNDLLAHVERSAEVPSAHLGCGGRGAPAPRRHAVSALERRTDAQGYARSLAETSKPTVTSIPVGPLS